MIPFVKDMAFQYDEASEGSPLIRRIVANNPGPFTYFGTGTYLVGRGDVAVIDPGPLMDDHLAAIIKAVEGERISAIVTTHTHIDHSPLARPLKELTGAPIYGRRDPQAPSGFEEANEAHFRPDVEVQDAQLIEGQGWTLEAIATPGHASNHICYALHEENSLFCGDHVMGWSTTVISPPDGDMGDYYKSLNKVRLRNFSTLWPTHGPPITDVEPFLAAYLEHRLDREKQILREISLGKTDIKDMVASMYAAVDPRLHPAAAHSVFAHLIHLTRRGIVSTQGEPKPSGQYTLAS